MISIYRANRKIHVPEWKLVIQPGDFVEIEGDIVTVGYNSYYMVENKNFLGILNVGWLDHQGDRLSKLVVETESSEYTPLANRPRREIYWSTGITTLVPKFDSPAPKYFYPTLGTSLGSIFYDDTNKGK